MDCSPLGLCPMEISRWNGTGLGYIYFSPGSSQPKSNPGLMVNKVDTSHQESLKSYKTKSYKKHFSYPNARQERLVLGNSDDTKLMMLSWKTLVNSICSHQRACSLWVSWSTWKDNKLEKRVKHTKVFNV